MMGVTILVHLILVLPVITLCSPDQWLHQIYVENKTGIDDPSCWEGGYSTPCLSLNMALTGAQHYNHCTAIFLQPGQHQLHYKSQLGNISQLAIVGNGSQGEVVIRCEPLAGLAFFWSEKISMTNVSLVNCGAMQNSSIEYNSIPLTIQAAILFTSSKEIRLTHVHVIETNGTGVVIYNSMGVVNIARCKVSSNELPCEQETMYGGGGLVIETNKATSQSVYIIMNSTFSNNTASSGHFLFWPYFNPGKYFGLGRGGGISVVFRGGAANNTVQLSSVYLDSNRAQFGGGLYLAFLGNTSNNTVSIDGTEVTRNEALLETGSLLTPTSSGGGVFIDFAASGTGFPFDNSITVSSSKFTSNTAETGGGMTVDVLSNSNGFTTAGNKLVIEKCAFDNNEAFQGASAYMSQSSKSSQTLLDTTVCCSNFTNGHCGAILKGKLSGNIVINAFQLIIRSHLRFADNDISAISLYFSSIELLPSTQLQFINNKDDLGPALYFADCSSLIVNSGTIAMIFENNVASNHGGSIYSEGCKLGLVGDRKCFIRHINSTLHPDDWNVNITFISENVVIYIDSAWSCIWPNSNGTDDHRMFCWIGWHFVDRFGLVNSCDNYLKSGPFSVIHNNSSENYTIHPGRCINPNKDFTVLDYWGHNITDETSLVVDVLVGNVRVIYNNECTCEILYEGKPAEFVQCSNQHVLLLPDLSSADYTNDTSQIMVHPPKFLGITAYVQFEACKHGAVISRKYGCICWMLIYTKVCIKSSLSSCTICFDKNPNCSYSNGGMCGSCNDTGYGVAINTPFYICTECPWYGGAIFVLVELVPVLIMMIILAVLHINITNGNLNGFVLYSQLITVQFPSLGYSSWLSTIFDNSFDLHGILLTVYSIWNLNFLSLYPEYFCIPLIDTAAKVVAFQYIIAVCPLLFILVTYIWIRWYNNGYRFVVWITRPVHLLLARFWQRFKIQPSLIDTYAGLLLISFMCFLATSVRLLYFMTTDLAFNTNHSINVAEYAVLGVTAVLCLLVFVVPLMVLLLFYHLKIFQQCLTWCKLDRPGIHALVDAYQGCFKNSATDGKERRYFAGLYLLCRFCYLAFIVLPFTLLKFITAMPVFELYYDDKYVAELFPLSVSEACLSFLMAGLVVILQPYKKTAHNVIDFLLLFFMTLIGAASFTNYGFVAIIIYIFYFLPVIVISIYLIYRLLKCCCSFKKQCPDRQYSPEGEDNPHLVPECRPLIEPTATEVALGDDYVPDDLYPDRMVNPGGYREQHCQYQPLEDSVLHEN